MAPVRGAAVGRRPRALGPEIEQASALIADLREGEAAPVADLRIIVAELVPVIAQRQRLREVPRQRLEAAEMPRPSRFVQAAEPDAVGGSPIQISRLALGEVRRLDRIEEVAAEAEERRIGQAMRRFSSASATSSLSLGEIVPACRPSRSNKRTLVVCAISIPAPAWGVGSA